MGTLHGICASGIHPIEQAGVNYYAARQMQVDFLRWDEKKMLSAMERITDVLCELVESYIKAGLDSVYYAALGGEYEFFTDEEFAKWIKPFDLRVLKAIQDAGGYSFLHICKDHLNMERYRDYSVYADVVNWGVYEAPFSLEMGKELGLIDKNQYNFLWVTEFPLLEWSEEEDRFMAAHHPFTMPMEEDWQYIDSDPGRVRAKAYDIVLNGVELGGGSVRIHQDDIQEKMFEVLGFTKEQAWEQFGFLLSAFQYGVPPHAGLAYGLDRIVMLLTHADSIREVIAFPKIKDASCLMTEAPGTVDEKQLAELQIAITPAPEKA